MRYIVPMHEKPVNEPREILKSGTAAARLRGYGSFEVEHIIRSAEDVGRLLRERRRAQGLSQEELALLAESHRNRIAEIEQGKPTERVTLLLRTLNELGLELVVRPRNIHRGLP